MERLFKRCLTAVSVTVLFCLTFAGCDKGPPGQQPAPSSVPNVVTADIQAAIEKHIEEQSRLGRGYFKLSFNDKEISLKLVRVHTEYLANLGPRRHFACVDLADVSGDVYDVDFFLAGDPGVMTVTETTVHKINGKPYYLWEQKRDKTWARVPVGKASQHLLGIITDRDEFEFLYRVKLPDIDDAARMWLPLAATNPFQTVEVRTITAPGTRRVVQDSEYGNKALILELNPQDSRKTIEIHYQVHRLEKAAYTADPFEVEKYLNAERLMPFDENFRSIAEKAIGVKKGELRQARALYDHVIDRMRYMKYGTGWGQGDAVYACNVRTGNCTDFHAYFIALARAVGIPARFAIGAAIPSERNEGGIDGYHCWVEFYADGKWWPIDITEADKYSSQSSYYFGHHPANRFEFSRGRDLILEPGPASGPINFLAYPVLEIAGEITRVQVEFSFNRSVSAN